MCVLVAAVLLLRIRLFVVLLGVSGGRVPDMLLGSLAELLVWECVPRKLVVVGLLVDVVLTLLRPRA